MVRVGTTTVVTLTAALAHDYTPSLDASFFHDDCAWAKRHSYLNDQAPAVETTARRSGIAHGVLDTEPREPTPVQNQPGQQTVAFLSGQMVTRG